MCMNVRFDDVCAISNAHKVFYYYMNIWRTDIANIQKMYS